MRESVKVMNELEQAKKGVSSSMDFICRFVWEKYGYKISRLFSNDVAEDREDLQQIFWMAVAEHIPHLDDRGNPVWHLAVRGFWRVGAHIRRKEKMAGLLSLDAPINDEEETSSRGARLRDDTVDVEGLIVQQLGDKQQVDFVLDLNLAPVARRALEAIMSGVADPTEMGFNKTLAQKIGVSPQRASQAMQLLRGSVETAGLQI